MIEPELLIRYCKGKCTATEQHSIEEAMNASAETREHIHDLRLSMAIFDDIKELESFDAEKAFRLTQGTIKKEANRDRRVQIMKYAAFLGLPLLFTLLTLTLLSIEDREPKVQYAEVNIPQGTIIRYDMPDNSVVWLNGGSRLKYPVPFEKRNRSVELVGEAYFEIKADPKNPFYVRTTDGLNIHVYGTAFNVSAYPDESCVETVLERGKVNVSSPDGGEVLVMKPGEKLVYDKETNSFVQTEADVYEKTAWKDGKLVFRNASLETVVKKLSRHFNTDIEFRNLSGRKCSYRATFKNETLSQILDYLSQSTTISWYNVEQIQKEDKSLTRRQIVLELN